MKLVGPTGECPVESGSAQNGASFWPSAGPVMPSVCGQKDGGIIQSLGNSETNAKDELVKGGETLTVLFLAKIFKKKTNYIALWFDSHCPNVSERFMVR